MKSSRMFPAVALLGCLAFSPNTFAAIDNNAAVVQLRNLNNGGCTEAGAQLNNCFTAMSDLITWVTGTRLPNQSKPLTVMIGPGKFGGFSVAGLNDTSFKGSGRDQTIIGNSQGAISIANSFRVSFQDLQITGGFPGPVYWSGTGSSTWINVFLNGSIYGWTETLCASTTPTTRPVHRWFSSTIQAALKVAYTASCSENWFYGSEIIAKGPGGFFNGLRAITAHSDTSGNYNPEIHVYGSVVRLIPDAGTTFPAPGSYSGEGTGLVAVVAGPGAKVHLHGTGIDVVGNDMPNDVAALVVTAGGMIHASGDGFTLQTPAPGKVYRILNEGGMVMAPYMWEEGATPKNIISADGADMQVITNTAGHPHLVISDNTCPSRWFDTVTQACR